MKSTIQYVLLSALISAEEAHLRSCKCVAAAVTHACFHSVHVPLLRHMSLQEVKRRSAERHAEAADLRNALREAQGQGSPPQGLTSLQAELSYLRSILPALSSLDCLAGGGCLSVISDAVSIYLSIAG